ncbi:MAG TPA: rod shape-determining protein MreD [Chloroflexota bacterium]|nr:rod shape-determining protein MreD [Chloroflexota bacterium]
MRFVFGAAFMAVVAVLQVSVFSRFSVGSGAPQLVLLCVVAWSLARGPVEGIFWGFCGGLFYDLASGGPVGVSALALILVAAVAGMVGGRAFGTNPLLPMFAMFVTTFVYVIVVSFVLATLHYPTDWLALIRTVALPTAVANAILGLIVYPVFAFVASHTSRQMRVEF